MNGAPSGPPWLRLRGRLVALADELRSLGHERESAALGQEIESWWSEQATWDAELQQGLAVHHDVANALVGVRGNVQLMLMGNAGTPPAIRERLEVVLRESTRIQDAVARLRELKARVVPELPEGRRVA